MLKTSLLCILAFSTPAIADVNWQPNTNKNAMPQNTNKDSYGRDTSGYLKAPGWGTFNGNNEGFLKTPGADSYGYLKTPGSGVVGGQGYLPTPGGYTWGPSDGYLPTPGGKYTTSEKRVPTTDPGKSVQMYTQAYGHQNLGPYIIPRWAVSAGDTQQELWEDTGEPTQLWTQNNGISDRELPNSQTANPELYKPSSLYDRTRPERPGGAVYFEPHDRSKGGFTNTDNGYYDVDRTRNRTGDIRDQSNKAPVWVSRRASVGGNWVWGQPVVIDGDSFKLEGHTIRLAGIDAPEVNQLCGKGNIPVACGQEAKTSLGFQIEHQVVACQVHYTDSVQRLISTCYTPDFEINGTLVAKGFAFPWKNAASPYEGMAENARDGMVGFWNLSWAHPEDWRLQQEQKASQNNRNFQNLNGEQSHGTKPFPYTQFGHSKKDRPKTVYIAPSAKN